MDTIDTLAAGFRDLQERTVKWIQANREANIREGLSPVGPARNILLDVSWKLYAASAGSDKDGMWNVLGAIIGERTRQDAKWGEQNHADMNQSQRNLMNVFESNMRDRCNLAMKEGRNTFMHIVLEELTEAGAAPTLAHLRKELVQLAACIVQWIEAIDRRSDRESVVILTK